MPRSDRLLRRVEKWLLPWFNRAEADARLGDAAKAAKVEEVRAVHTEDLRRQSIDARIAAESVRKAYALAAKRLER